MVRDDIVLRDAMSAVVPGAKEAIARAMEEQRRTLAAMATDWPTSQRCRCVFVPTTDIPANGGRNGGENMPEMAMEACEAKAHERFVTVSYTYCLEEDILDRESNVVLATEDAASALNRMHVELRRVHDDNEDLRRRNLDRAEQVAGLTAENARLRQLDGFTVSAMRTNHSLALRRERNQRLSAERVAAEAEARMVGMARDAKREADAAFERGVAAGRDALRHTIRTVLGERYEATGGPYSSHLAHGERYLSTFGWLEGISVACWLNALRERILHAIDPHGEDA